MLNKMAKAALELVDKNGMGFRRVARLIIKDCKLTLISTNGFGALKQVTAIPSDLSAAVSEVSLSHAALTAISKARLLNQISITESTIEFFDGKALSRFPIVQESFPNTDFIFSKDRKPVSRNTEFLMDVNFQKIFYHKDFHVEIGASADDEMIFFSGKSEILGAKTDFVKVRITK
jgi:hypothetical protein